MASEVVRDVGERTSELLALEPVAGAQEQLRFATAVISRTLSRLRWQPSFGSVELVNASLSESGRLRLALVQDLARSLSILQADHDLVRSRYAQTVAGPGSVVGQPRQALDPGVTQNRAEQLRFGFGTGHLNCDKLVDGPMLIKPVGRSSG